MSELITGSQFADMIICASDALNAHKQAINELNVFPVPDGDTGTNMTLTVSAAATELRKKSYTRIDEAAEKTAGMLLRGARGNSGVILSLLFRGVSKGLKGKAEAEAIDFAAAMRDGVDAAYKAVMKPAEGTILTVSRCATNAAYDCAKAQGSVEDMFRAAISAASDALALTVEQNPVLKRAGVVDAGGKGYLVMLEAMLACFEGKISASDAAVEITDDGGSVFEEFSTGEIEFAYDTVYIVRKTTGRTTDEYRAYLDTIGDSIVISEDDEIFKVHVHTNVPGEALTEAAKYGVLELAKIENMRTQHDDLVSGSGERHTADSLDDEADAPSEPAAPEKRFGFVSVCAGEGLAALFRELGADGIVTGGQTMNPSTEDILREVNRTPAETVYVFPNNKNIIMAAQQCVPLSGKKVIVIPSRSVPEGVTAMLNLDPDAEEDELTQIFLDSIKNVHTAQVTYAARDSEFDGHSIRAGEYLGLLDGALLGSCGALEELLCALNSEIGKFSPEFISVYYGEDVKEPDAQEAAKLISAAYPDAEVSVINGGQPVYYFLVAIE